MTVEYLSGQKTAQYEACDKYDCLRETAVQVEDSPVQKRNDASSWMVARSSEQG